DSALAAGQTVEAQPRGDRVQPRREPRVSAELGEPPVGPEERLLGDVLGLGGIPEHPEREPVDAMLLGADQLLGRRAIACPKPTYELRGVTSRRLSHGCRCPRPEPIAHGDARTS